MIPKSDVQKSDVQKSHVQNSHVQKSDVQKRATDYPELDRDRPSSVCMKRGTQKRLVFDSNRPARLLKMCPG